MNDDKVLDEAGMIENRFHQFEKFCKDLVLSSDLLDNEMLSMNNRLSKLNSETNNLQNKKKQLDELKLFKLEADVNYMTEKIKQLDFLKTHLAVLNQRKELLEKFTLEQEWKSEADTLQNQIDSAWKYFNDKRYKLDNEISNLKLKIANRRDFMSKMYEKECIKYKKSIEKLEKENHLLQKKLNVLSKLPEN